MEVLREMVAIHLADIRGQTTREVAVGVTFQYRTKSGAVFEVTPALVAEIDALTARISKEIADQKNAGNFIGYLSVPVSKRGGGDFTTNVAMAAAVADRVTRDFGSGLWMLNPAAYDLPKGATGSDYMAVWADVLAGSDGLGRDFDLIYFVGPTDVWRFFGAESRGKIDAVKEWLERQAKTSVEYKRLAENPENARGFLRYYALRGSAAFSKGAHDEWNIAIRLNSLRDVGDSIAIYFDGRPVEPGDYDDPTTPGTEIGVLH